MSKKKKQIQNNRESEKKQEISIEDDPYWQVSDIFMDPQRIGRYIRKFERFEDEYPFWVDELMDGTPTFYCVLGVERGASIEEIETAYEKKIKFSSYADDVIEEAYDVLSDYKLQKKYDKLLSLFGQITKCMPSLEKKEMIKYHNAKIQAESDFIRMESLLTTYRGYFQLYPFGIPDLYEIIGLSNNVLHEEITKKCENKTELFRKIYTILGNPASRSDYDFMIYFTIQYGGKKLIEVRNHNRKIWDNMDQDLFEKIVISTLTDPVEIEESIERFLEIMNRNHDWKQYLPPNKKTFFSILGLDYRILTGDKKEIEKVFREKYKDLEKTPEVNLAYSMLKNASQREDYLWVIENCEIINLYQKIMFPDVEIDDLSSEIIQDREAKESPQSEKAYTQMTLDNIIEMMEEILEE